jgi:hypothetical protein
MGLSAGTGAALGKISQAEEIKLKDKNNIVSSFIDAPNTTIFHQF